MRHGSGAGWRETSSASREPIGRRRWLERRFRSSLNRTILEEIRRVRLEHARHLLTNTDLSVGEVAVGSGFNSTVRFSDVFRETVGVPPSVFRKQYRRP